MCDLDPNETSRTQNVTLLRDSKDDDTSGARSSTTTRQVDPIERALVTFMYGMAVHFGTIWMVLMLASGSSSSIISSGGGGAKDDAGAGAGADASAHLNNVSQSNDCTSNMSCINTDMLLSTSMDANNDNNNNNSVTNILLLLPWLPTLLLIHEYWIYLQHVNLLANPYCQRLDRQYGIALLRGNQHWAIAGTLTAYWCRESISMFLCLPFITIFTVGTRINYTDTNNTNSNNITAYLVVYSLLYHAFKSQGVRQDALRRYSPTFGIMRTVIDKFYLHSLEETLVTMVRLSFQALDTYVHAMILAQLYNSPFLQQQQQQQQQVQFDPVTLLHRVFGIWVIHAAMNQYFRCSTATLMVQAWYWLTDRSRPTTTTKITAPTTFTNRSTDNGNGNLESSNAATVSDIGNSSSNNGACDTDSELDSSEDSKPGELLLELKSPRASTTGSSMHDGGIGKDFVVRTLLHKGRVPSEFVGMRGAASRGVDAAVRIETRMMILAVVYVFGFGVAPFTILTTDSSSVQEFQWTWTTTLYAWLLFSILCSVDSILFPRSKHDENQTQRSSVTRWGSIRNTMDLAMIVMAVPSSSSYAVKALALLLAVIVTTKSFLRSERWRAPVLIRYAMLGVEGVAKMALAKLIVNRNETVLVWIDAFVCLVWMCVSVTQSSAASIPTKSRVTTKVPDIAFLSHGFELSDVWVFWLLPYSLQERWQRPWWSIPLWPIHYLVGYYVCNWRVRLFGDRWSIFNVDNVNYGGIQMQTWGAAYFARHFFTSPWQVKSNIEAAARHANQSGIKVLCLGGLNKAESINGGGVGVVQALGPHPSVSVVHGNHLTAAAVVETTRQCFGKGAKVFLTGASSKVGWAVAQGLRDEFGYEILCHSTDESRRDIFEKHGFQATSKLSDGTLFSDLWIVGKFDQAAASLMPQGGTAVVFSVQHPFEARKDIRVVEGGTLHMDLSRLDKPRSFTNKLKEHEIYACHAAGIVAAHRIKCGMVERDGTMHEIGPVDPLTMDGWLVDAQKLGISVPIEDPVRASCIESTSKSATVVVVGAGPAGLAVAASLIVRGIPCTVLEEQTNVDAFGSWDQHFSGLEVTTQKRWCELPGLPMSKEDFPSDFVTALDYKRYLQLYSKRFGILIKRGVRVNGIARGGKTAPWIVECNGSGDSIQALAVVVATGMHRIPQRDTSDEVCVKLNRAGIYTVHSTDMKDKVTWEKAMNAAQDGKLCIVGLGNSAADICTAILKSRGSSTTTSNSQSAIHVAIRTVPPVFPRRSGPFHVDTTASIIRWMPSVLQEFTIRLLWRGLPSSVACNKAFPAHLPRWSRVAGRVPVIDKHGQILAGLESGVIVPHGTIENVSSEGVTFKDAVGTGSIGVPIDMVILATGYKDERLIAREDRLNGLFLVGFKNKRLLPLKTIGEEAKQVATDIARNLWLSPSDP